MCLQHLERSGPSQTLWAWHRWGGQGDMAHLAPVVEDMWYSRGSWPVVKLTTRKCARNKRCSCLSPLRILTIGHHAGFGQYAQSCKQHYQEKRQIVSLSSECKLQCLRAVHAVCSVRQPELLTPELPLRACRTSMHRLLNFEGMLLLPLADGGEHHVVGCDSPVRQGFVGHG